MQKLIITIFSRGRRRHIHVINLIFAFFFAFFLGFGFGDERRNFNVGKKL